MYINPAACVYRCVFDKVSQEEQDTRSDQTAKKDIFLSDTCISILCLDFTDDFKL